LQARTGFALDYDPAAGTTPAPTAEELGVLRTRVREAVARTYPRFAAAFGAQR
ncbi:MAG: CoA synthetase, partial [Candidatus Rokubacteria bacterium]|nr:CoA synthetase [Candidatus Rokubacteria bacterium]